MVIFFGPSHRFRPDLLDTDAVLCDTGYPIPAVNEFHAIAPHYVQFWNILVRRFTKGILRHNDVILFIGWHC